MKTFKGISVWAPFFVALLLFGCGGGGGGGGNDSSSPGQEPSQEPIQEPGQDPVQDPGQGPDTEAPVITLNGDQTMIAEAGRPYSDGGATAEDNIDGSVPVTTSGSVDTSMLGVYELTYTATDAAGNEASVTRQITVADRTGPEIVFTRGANMLVLVGEPFEAPEVIAEDLFEGEVAVNPKESVTVLTDNPGVYRIIYEASDSSGNRSERALTVRVEPPGNVNDPQQLQGCVVEGDGTPVATALVLAEVTNGNGTSRRWVEEDGSFTIPTAKNSEVLLTVRSIDGDISKVLNISTNSDATLQLEDCITLESHIAAATLTWGELPGDLDGKFFGPSSESGDTTFTVFSANPQEAFADSGSVIWLDVDGKTGFGQEVTTITSFPYAGRYSYAVRQYNFRESGNIADSPANVEFSYIDQSGIRQTLQFSPPGGEASLCWAVFELEIDNAGNVVSVEEPAEKWRNASYCDR